MLYNLNFITLDSSSQHATIRVQFVSSLHYQNPLVCCNSFFTSTYNGALIPMEILRLQGKPDLSARFVEELFGISLK